MTHPVLTTAALERLAQDSGLELFGWLPVARASDLLAGQRENLVRWQQAGYAAGMRYMLRDPLLFTSLQSFLPECRSVVSFFVPYSSGRMAAELPKPEFGRVARYAWGLDYHDVLKERLRRLVAAVASAAQSEVRSREFSDAVPLLERALGTGAGLGFPGRNSLLIRPGAGSFAFCAELLWNVELRDAVEASRAVLSRLDGIASGCGRCRSCVSACPAGAIVADGVVDSRRCISYLTIEKRGMLEPEEERLIGSWVFGCDECQTGCPFNRGSRSRPVLAEFSPDRGAGPSLDLRKLLALRSEESFVERFGKTALMRAGRGQLLRNACCVAANSGALSLEDALSAACNEDPAEIVRETARRSLLRLREQGRTPGRREKPKTGLVGQGQKVQQ